MCHSRGRRGSFRDKQQTCTRLTVIQNHQRHNIPFAIISKAAPPATYRRFRHIVSFEHLNCEHLKTSASILQQTMHEQSEKCVMQSKAFQTLLFARIHQCQDFTPCADIVHMTRMFPPGRQTQIRPHLSQLASKIS